MFTRTFELFFSCMEGLFPLFELKDKDFPLEPTEVET